MERKTFLTTVAATAAAAVPIAASAATYTEADFDAASNRNITFMLKIVQATIDDLNGDARDYGGYRAQAVTNLQTAYANLQQALKHVHE